MVTAFYRILFLSFFLFLVYLFICLFITGPHWQQCFYTLMAFYLVKIFAIIIVIIIIIIIIKELGI